MIGLAAILVASASLHITVWPQGQGQPGKHVYSLECGNPIGGTLPKRVAACTKLMRFKRPFAPTPMGVACTQIYGGPQEALGNRSFPREPSPSALQQKGRVRDRPLEQGPVPVPRVEQRLRTPPHLR